MKINFFNGNYYSSATISRNFLLLFTIWPFLAFVSALGNYNQREAKGVVYIYLVYYGLSYFVGEKAMDSFAYVEQFQFNATLPFSEFFKIVGGLYTSETSVDIVEPLISFIVSRFTNYYGFLFAAYASVFGFFYLRSINLLYDRYKLNPGWNAIIFMIFFISVISITTINGFRMWTAAWAFFYGAYHVIFYHNKKFFLFTLGACLIHWSFISANLILILYFILGNRNLLYFPLTVASFILPDILIPFFNTLSVGGAIQNRITGYTNEEYMLSVQESFQEARWFVNLSHELIFYYLIISVFFIYFFRRKLMNDKSENNLFSFMLLFLSFVNFGKAIPSFGNRFQIVFILFATLYVFLYCLKLSNKKITLLTLIGLFPMLLYAAVEFRIGSEVINTWIFLPGLGLPLFVDGIPLADFLFNN